MEFKKRRCKVLHLDRNNPVHWNMLGAVWLESSFAERVLQILVDNKLSMKTVKCLCGKEGQWCSRVH